MTNARNVCGCTDTALDEEGLLECAFARYQPVTGAIPARARTDHNPLNRKEYLLHVMRGVPARR